MKEYLGCIHPRHYRNYEHMPKIFISEQAILKRVRASDELRVSPANNCETYMQ